MESHIGTCSHKGGDTVAFSKFLYNLISWKNKSESLDTPIGAQNLNKMDSAIKTIGDNLNTAYDELSEGKLDKDTAYTMVKDVTYDDGSGIFTVTKLDGTTIAIDTKLEKLVTNWNYDKDSQKLILTLDDGTIQEVDLSSLITQYEFTDSDTIAFTVGSDGSVTTNVKDGSITEAKLQPNYLADIKTQASNAEGHANNASDYAGNASYDAKMAQSYANGTSGMREGEATDNAKYYMEQAKEFSAGSASNISYDNTESGAESNNVQDALDEISEKLEDTVRRYYFSSDANTHSIDSVGFGDLIVIGNQTGECAIYMIASTSNKLVQVFRNHGTVYRSVSYSDGVLTLGSGIHTSVTIISALRG